MRFVHAFICSLALAFTPACSDGPVVTGPKESPDASAGGATADASTQDAGDGGRTGTDSGATGGSNTGGSADADAGRGGTAAGGAPDDAGPSAGGAPVDGGLDGQADAGAPLGPYPRGPYGGEVGDTFPNLAFSGYVNDDATGLANLQPWVPRYTMAD